MSNSLVLIDREFIHPTINGVDFGGQKLWCIVRSPEGALVWVFGSSLSVNGFTSYYSPHLMLLTRKHGSQGHRDYVILRSNRTRLSPALVREFESQIQHLFADDIELQMTYEAVMKKKTLLIDGGWPPYMPARSEGSEAFQRWRDATHSKAMHHP